MNGKPWLAALLTTGLYACAHSSDQIAAQYVSPLVYENYDCRQISAEYERINRRVHQLAASIDKNARGDSIAMGVGLVLFWPALFFIDGDSPEAAEYARLKGEYEALEKVSIQKSCGLEFRELQPAPAEEEQPKPGHPTIMGS